MKMEDEQWTDEWAALGNLTSKLVKLLQCNVEIIH